MITGIIVFALIAIVVSSVLSFALCRIAADCDDREGTR